MIIFILYVNDNFPAKYCNETVSDYGKDAKNETRVFSTACLGLEQAHDSGHSKLSLTDRKGIQGRFCGDYHSSYGHDLVKRHPTDFS